MKKKKKTSPNVEAKCKQKKIICMLKPNTNKKNNNL